MSGTWPLARAAIRSQLHGLVLGALLDIPYDGESGGPFQLGETLTFSGGATGVLQQLTDNGSTGMLQVRINGSSAAPADNETITGGTSAATAAVNGSSTGIEAKTLTAFEYAPRGHITPDRFPYAFILPAEIQVDRFAGSYRQMTVDLRVRVLLAPGEATLDINQLHKQYDGMVVALADAWDDAATLDGYADISVQQAFGGLAQFSDNDNAWGFDMVLGELHISEIKTFSA